MKSYFLSIFLLLSGLTGTGQNSWVQTTPLPWPGGSVRALAIIGDNLFAGTSGGIYLSQDSGATWVERNGSFSSLDLNIYAMVAYGTDLYAAGTIPSSYGPVVLKSSDLGITWTNIKPAPSNGFVTSMVIYNNEIYVGISSSFNHGIFKSPLAGIGYGTWSSFNTGLSSNKDIGSLAVNGTSIMAGVIGSGVWVSPAGTANWTLTSGITSGKISSMAVKGQRVIAGNNWAPPVLYQSTNSGTNWSSSNPVIFEDKPVNVLLVNQNRIYAGVNSIGVFVSDDDGVSWSTYREGMTNPANPSGWNCNQMNVRSLLVKGNTIFAGTDCGVWKRSVTQQYNTIYGKAFYDANSNNTQEGSEWLYPFAMLKVIKGPDTVSVASSTGDFNVKVDTGMYTSYPVLDLVYHMVTPAMETSSFTTYSNTDTVVFAIQPIAGKRDMSIKLFAMGPARAGYAVSYRLVYANKGTDTSDVTLELVKSSKLNYISSSSAVSYAVADTLRWNIMQLKPGQGGYIDINFQLQPPPSVNLNDTLVSVARISSDKIDLTLLDNESTLRQRVTGSYDPNDKKENHNGRIPLSAISDGEKLQYTIRFQNTGNDTAFNIKIKDTLDAKLDWNSLRMINASHDYQLNIANGICTWIFDNIKLVDSNHNEPLSHGFISFDIRTIPTVVAGAVISNKASIYFDYNPPIVTNTDTTMVVTEVLPIKLHFFNVTKRDNGNLLHWQVSQQINFSHFIIERSENGYDFSPVTKISAGAHEFSFLDKTFRRTVNYYRLKMVDVDGSYEYSITRQINNQGSIDISVYPNPARDRLQLRIDDLQPKKMQVQILTQNGRIVSSQSLSVTAGTNIISLNIGMLAKGVYLLKTSCTGEIPIVLKFEKQ